jgi:hypothetical protein
VAILPAEFTSPIVEPSAPRRNAIVPLESLRVKYSSMPSST